MKRTRTIALLSVLGLSLAGGLVYIDSLQEAGPAATRLVGALGPGSQETTPVTPDALWPEGWVSINGGPDDPAEIRVIEKTPDRQRLEFKLPGYYQESVAIGGIKCTRVTIPHLLKIQETGLPEVPFLTASLLIPDGGRTYLKVVEQRTREIKVDPVEPSLGHVLRNVNPATLEPEFSDFYQGTGLWPKAPVELGATYTIREYTGVNVRLGPLCYAPGKGALLVTEHLVVDVITEGGQEKLPDQVTPDDLGGAGYDRIYSRLFTNYPEPVAAEKYQRLPVRGRMLLVADDSFTGYLQEFTDWKRQRGIDVTVATVGELGGTAAGISQHIQTLYDQPAGLTWVLLVGDRDQVPTQVGLYDGSDSDSRYALTAGSDLYPDLFVSRISAQNSTQLLTQLNRFIAYEKTPLGGDAATWYAQGVGIASDEGTPSDFKRADALRDALLGYGFSQVGQVYQNLGGTTTSIRSYLEKGCSVVNYLGHGTGYGWTSVPFFSSDVRDMGNTGRWPWIIDVSCSNGDFALSECFAEAWLRAGTPEQPTGAVAMIAASSLAPWIPPTVMQTEAIELLTTDQANTIGSLLYSGLMKVLDKYDGLDVAQQVLEQNVIFGDCSLMVRTAEPKAFTVAETPRLTAGDTGWTVAVSGPAGSVATLTSSGVLHGAALVDALGQAQIALTEPVDGLDSVVFTVTGYNMEPFIQTIAVNGSGGSDLPDPEPETEPEAVLPAAVALLGNYPNPFNPSTHIAFELPRDMRVRLAVYDIRGSLVRQLLNEVQPAGRSEVLWDGRDTSGRPAASGVYLYWLRTEDGDHAGRMMLTK